MQQELISDGELLFANHASLLFRHGDKIFWTDPWVISPAFGSWVQHPAMPADVFRWLRSLSPDCLFVCISHGHDDHCDDHILKTAFADANFIIPAYRSKGFSKRIERIANREVIEVGESFQEVGGLNVGSYINADFTGNDATLLFETPDYLLVHANDNWHSQPDEFFGLFEAHRKPTNHYFCQIGVADCFPRNFPQFSDEETEQIVRQRVAEFAAAVHRNGQQLGVDTIYAYANQSTIIDHTSRPAFSNPIAVKAIEKDFDKPAVVQLEPGFRMTLSSGAARSADGLRQDTDVFGALLAEIENLSQAYVESYLERRGLDFSARLRCATSAGHGTGDAEATLIELVADRLIWSRIMMGELNLEAIIIGGSGQILRHPKSSNISPVHRALSEFSYILQAKIRRGEFLVPE